MTGSMALSVAPGDGDTTSTQFPHVLGGVALAGAAARLAGLLEPEFLAEAGWDALTGVLSPPGGHRLLGRPICPARGCSTTSNGCACSAAGGCTSAGWAWPMWGCCRRHRGERGRRRRMGPAGWPVVPAPG
jgi:hypothetical protein